MKCSKCNCETDCLWDSPALCWGCLKFEELVTILYNRNTLTYQQKESLLKGPKKW